MSGNGLAPLTTWEMAKGFIEIGTVESLGKLGRSEEQLATYRAFMDKVSGCSPNRGWFGLYEAPCLSADADEAGLQQCGRLHQDFSPGARVHHQLRCSELLLLLPPWARRGRSVAAQAAEAISTQPASAAASPDSSDWLYTQRARKLRSTWSTPPTSESGTKT